MKKIILLWHLHFVLCAFVLLPQNLFAKDILTATPVTYMLATQLMQGTPISTTYIVPKRFGIERLNNWFSGKGGESVLQAGSRARVAITLKALWPNDLLFAFARQGNINLIEIDASQAISPRAKGVATVQSGSDKRSLYAWLNPNNLNTMLGIVSDDLQRVWPEYAFQIESNQQALLVKIRLLINEQQQTMFDKQIDSVVLLSDQLEDFASSNQLFVVQRLLTAELEWSANEKLALQQLVKTSPEVWLVTTKKVSKQLMELLPDFRQFLVVDSIDRWGKAGINSKQPLQRWLF